MIDLSEYELKEKYRKVLDHLSDNDKVRVAIEKYNNFNVLKDIVTYYDLQDNPLLKTLGLTKYGKDPFYGKDPYYVYAYARYVIKGRWPEAEEFIKTDPEHAYFYSKHVIKGRWLEAEDIIKTDPFIAYYYAKNVMKHENFWDKN